jgi:hypothetical protein
MDTKDSILQWIEGEMADIYTSFKDDAHFKECIEYAGSQEEQMRVFDTGFIAGLEYAKRNIPRFFEQYESKL